MASTFKGGDKLSKRLHAINDPSRLLRKWQLDTAAEARRLAPQKTRNLTRSIAPGEFTGSAAFVRARAAYAAYVEKGTRPHVILPRKKPFLAWPAPGVSVTLAGRVRTGEVRRLGHGAYIFAMKVNHPGTKPRPFLEPGARKAAEKGGLKDVAIQLWNGAA